MLQQTISVALGKEILGDAEQLAAQTRSLANSGLDRALALYADGDTEAASKTLIRFIEDNESKANAQTELALAYRNLGNIQAANDPRAAIKSYQREAQLDPAASESTRLAIAGLKRRLSDLSGAIVDANFVLKAAQDDLSMRMAALQEIGAIENAEKNYDAAIDSYEKAAEAGFALLKKQQDDYYTMASLLIGQSQISEIISSQGDTWNAISKLGHAYAEVDDRITASKDQPPEYILTILDAVNRNMADMLRKAHTEEIAASPDKKGSTQTYEKLLLVRMRGVFIAERLMTMSMNPVRWGTTLARSHLDLGDALRADNRQNAAEAAFKQALGVATDVLHQKEDSREALSLEYMALEHLGDMRSSRSDFEAALAVALRLAKEDPEHWGQAISMLKMRIDRLGAVAAGGRPH
jgi:tetratricopeptide (TPR) repeat protein